MENKVPLSQTTLWQHQARFYQQQGIQAWNGKVPYYATSNPRIANSYAQIIISFIQEIYTQIIISKTPVYIVELGAGSGTFSFYLLKQLDELLKPLNLPSQAIVYVMTDMVEVNIQFWESHAAFKPYLEQGLLDFAKFDLQADTDINLRHKKISLSKNAEHATLFIANYVFDTLPHDVFQITNGEIQEILVDADPVFKTPPSNHSFSLTQMGNGVCHRVAKLPYYQDMNLDSVLANYLQYCSDRYLLFPIGSFHAIKKLQEIAKDRLLLLISDKGYSQHPECYEQGLPELVFHDKCFSMTLNLCAIGHYFKELKGDYYHQATQQYSLTSSAFILGNTFENLPLTRQTLKNYFETFGPGNFLSLYYAIEINRFNYPLESLLAYLVITCWDPHLFNTCLDAILQKVKYLVANAPVLSNLYTAMEKIAANIYPIPGQINTLANIALFFHELQKSEQALHYYQASLEIEKAETTLYNMGLCYVALNQPQKALQKFRETLALNSSYILARGWISQLESQAALDTPGKQ